MNARLSNAIDRRNLSIFRYYRLNENCSPHSMNLHYSYIDQIQSLNPLLLVLIESNVLFLFPLLFLRQFIHLLVVQNEAKAKSIFLL